MIRVAAGERLPFAQEDIRLDEFLANRFGKAYSVFDSSAPMGRAA